MRLLTAISFIILIASCAGKQKKEVEVIPEITRDWEEIKADSVLTILAENSPASYFIYRGRNMGYEYELLYEFTKDKNIRLQVQMVNDLDEMFSHLDSCYGDVIACNLTITEERSQVIDYTVPHLTTRQVLIQRKPEDFRKLSKQEQKDTLIGEIEELQGKTIHVWQNSSYFKQITLLNDQLALNMEIIATDGDLITAELIRMVSDGEIDYTIADENVAKIDLRYYSNLDISLKLSGEDSIAFGIRKTSPALRDSLNAWLIAKENQSTIGEVKRKYFKRKNLSNKANQDYSSLNGDVLSPYDEIIKSESDKIGWDWRLTSAIIYQESKFETWKVSWAGAFGIFQFMPATAAGYGITPESSAEAQIKAGIKKLNKNFQQWLEIIPDSSECVKFTLATFNAGRAHVDDARALCNVYDLDDTIWEDNVSDMIRNLSKPTYYRDKVVKHGYCRGIETYEYVIEVIQRYEEYKAAFPTPDA
ncbi:MAG: transporter substrate-binding domain-containing protein [Crocinitomix sp.]|nr:transporter substrate-binding domain-containing protein [Crocinitomix sp.]